MSIYTPGTKLRTEHSSVVVTKKGQLYEIRRNAETLFADHRIWDNEDLWLADTKAKKEDVIVEPKSTIKKPLVPRGRMAKWTYDQLLCANNIQHKSSVMSRMSYHGRSIYQREIEFFERHLAAAESGPQCNKYYIPYGTKSLKEAKAKLKALDEQLAQFPELKDGKLYVRKNTKYSFVEINENKMFPIYFHASTGILGTGNPNMPTLGRTFEELGIRSPKTLWTYTDNTFTALKPIPYSP